MSDAYRDNIARRTHMDKVRLTQALADNLSLSRNQRGRAVSIAATLNGRRFNRIGGINALAAWSDRLRRRPGR